MPAEVLELADRHDSGSCVGNDVWVQVPSSAYKQKKTLYIQGFFYCTSKYIIAGITLGSVKE